MDANLKDVRMRFKGININIDPSGADYLILPVFANGQLMSITIDTLNRVGYSPSEFNRSIWDEGIGSYYNESTRPSIIFFVVGHSGMVDKAEMYDNLTAVFTEYKLRLTHKKIWIPSVGVREGLSLKESHDIIFQVIKSIQLKADLFLSLPTTDDARNFLLQLNKSTHQDTSEASELDENNGDATAKLWSRKFFLVSPQWIDFGGSYDGQFIIERDLAVILGNGIHENDIVFCNNVRMEYPQTEVEPLPSIQLMVIIGIGIVKIVENNQAQIKWHIKNIEIPFDTETPYDRMMEELHPYDLQRIFYAVAGRVDLNGLGIMESEINAILGAPLAHSEISAGATSVSSKISGIPGIMNDSINTVDHLNIASDVKAFARIIASGTFQPPLAIALLGKWGAGKSFFMRQLQEEIDVLRHSKVQHVVDGRKIDAYKQGVISIHFNAWSYMDANLWASLISRIFESLDEYINGELKEDQELKEVKNELTSNLLTLSTEETKLNEDKILLNAKLLVLKEQQEALAEKLNEQKEQLRLQTRQEIIANIDTQFDVLQALRKDLEQNESFKYSEKQLKAIIPEEDWKNPMATYAEAQAGATWVKVFFKKGKRISNILWMLGILGLILFIPPFMQRLSYWIADTPFYIPPFIYQLLALIIPFVVRVRNTVREWQPVVMSFWKIKTSYEERVAAALAAADELRRQLDLDMADKKAQLQHIDSVIVELEARKLVIETQLIHALSTTALHRFINKRWASGDYSKHLGIISVIRKDLETLNTLFTGHQEEIVENRKLPNLSDRLRTPLERIVLYIDDLDRCPEETVVQVLEAINLLMAFPLFVVVAGIDGRWIRTALLRRHVGQFTSQEPLDPCAYLEKIFQIPFHLKSPDDLEVKNMILKLSGVSYGETRLVSSQDAIPVNRRGINAHASEIDAVQQDVGISQETVVSNADLNLTDATIHHPNQQPEKDSVELLSLTQMEINMMQQMSGVIGNNPRIVKRFINVFRVIKAHEAFRYRKAGSNIELMTVLFLIALPLGPYQDYTSDLGTALRHAQVGEIGLLSKFIVSKPALQQALPRHAISVLAAVPMEDIRKHYEFILRFSFKGA